MNAKIFISYIREDSAPSAGWLYETLKKKLGKRNIFKDIDSIPLGEDFKELIEKEIKKCDILLVVIGNKFKKITNEYGIHKIKDPNEFINIEIFSAINLEKIIIPVLVDGARMPEINELPENLHKFNYFNGIKLRYDSWGRDTEKLFCEIKNKEIKKQSDKTKWTNFLLNNNNLIIWASINVFLSMPFFACFLPVLSIPIFVLTVKFKSKKPVILLIINLFLSILNLTILIWFIIVAETVPIEISSE